MTDHVSTVRDIAQDDPETGATTVANHFSSGRSVSLICSDRDRVGYDAFGRVTSESNPAVDCLFLFTARPFDAEAKQVENLAQKVFGQQSTPKNLNRWYDASVGRWLSEDPIGFAAGDGNLYRYVINEVLERVDAFGLSLKDLTNKMLRQACEQLYGRGSAFTICCKIANTLRGKNCNELFTYCTHIRTHRLFGAKASEICLTLYNPVC